MFQTNHMALPPGGFEQSTSRANQFLILMFFDEVDVLVWIKTPNNLNIVLSCLLRPPYQTSTFPITTIWFAPLKHCKCVNQFFESNDYLQIGRCKRKGLA